jgi:flagellar biosynthesis chaperone FliJ
MTDMQAALDRIVELVTQNTHLQNELTVARAELANLINQLQRARQERDTYEYNWRQSQPRYDPGMQRW